MIQPRQANFASFLPFHLTLSPKRMAAWKCGLVGWYIFREWRLRKSSEESDLQVPQNSDKFRTELMTWTLKDAIKMDDTPNPWHGVFYWQVTGKVIFENCVLHSLSEWVLARRRRISHEISKTRWFNFELPQARITTLKKKHLKAQYRYQKCYIYNIYVYIHCNMHVWIKHFAICSPSHQFPRPGQWEHLSKRKTYRVPGQLNKPYEVIQPVEIPWRIIRTWM